MLPRMLVAHHGNTSNQIEYNRPSAIVRRHTIGAEANPRMPTELHPTAYPQINATLRLLEGDVRAVLGARFAGMYLYGSLASGDFDPATSDVDFLVVTAGPLAE